jgi:hypothetical protein
MQESRALAAERRRQLVEQIKARQAEAKAKEEAKKSSSLGEKPKPYINAVMAAAQGIHLLPFEITLG